MILAHAGTTKMTAHTPGPWGVEKALHEQRWTVAQLEGAALIVADAYTETDARLIAAAPEMLEALEAMVEHTCHLAGTRPCTHDDKARAAIRAAKEETV